MKRRRAAVSSSLAIAAVVVVIVGASLLYLGTLAGAGHGPASTSSLSSSTSQSTVQGIIAGVVTVGPSQPVCTQNQACTVDLTGYSLVLVPQCSAPSPESCQRQNITAPIAPSGHYSVLLAPGNYTITGLSPSCGWLGCSSSFPRAVAVEAGQQLVVNIDVDTGIK